MLVEMTGDGGATHLKGRGNFSEGTRASVGMGAGPPIMCLNTPILAPKYT